MTFAEWFEKFYTTYCEKRLSYGCCREYRIICEKHYNSIMGMSVDSIKPIHIQQCMNTAVDYSVSRKRKVYFLLHHVFDEAIFNDIIQFNPVDKVKAPKKIRKNICVLEPAQLKKLFDTDNTTSRMLQLELWTGLRRGELLALHWDNINLEERRINVCQTLVTARGGEKIRPSTKSNKDRIVPLSESAVNILNRIKQLDKPQGFLFTSDGTTPMSLHTYHDHYKKYYAKQQEKYPELPYVTPHKLRHAYASYLIMNGADIETVRMLLGHSDITTTSIYVHTNLSRMRAATDLLSFV